MPLPHPPHTAPSAQVGPAVRCPGPEHPAVARTGPHGSAPRGARTAPSRLTAVLGAACLVAACGDAPSPGPAVAPGTPASVQAVKTAKASPAGPEDALPPPRCPPVTRPGGTGPDIVGLRLGMPLDEALNLARCALPDGVLSLQPRWFQQLRTGSVTLGNQAFAIQRGETSPCEFRKLGDAMKCGPGRRVWHHVDELVSVAAPGLDGRQAVAGIWRQQHWKAGEMPAREAVLQALRDKYGREGALRDDPHGTLAWRNAVDGTPLAAGDPRFEACAGIRARPGSQHWREDCGLSISADVVPARDNPQLVQSLYVGMAHQARLLQIGDAMQAEIDRLEAARQAGELQRAAGATPRL